MKFIYLVFTRMLGGVTDGDSGLLLRPLSVEHYQLPFVYRTKVQCARVYTYLCACIHTSILTRARAHKHTLSLPPSLSLSLPYARRHAHTRAYTHTHTHTSSLQQVSISSLAMPDQHMDSGDKNAEFGVREKTKYSLSENLNC